MAERIYQNARRMEAIMKDGLFSFDDEPKNRLEFTSQGTDPLSEVVIAVGMYLPDKDDYLRAELTVWRLSLSSALASMSVESCNTASCPGTTGGYFLFGRDEFRNPTFTIFKDDFPNDAHVIDQELFP